ncbi:hypothetical protein BABINDRAFT_10095 [Babjeviella inositovora NRRL Y-12698]|uniref:Uncharacterized protein n=1 Tax=Babjeviella inositovora NRRL Y-12698 TaxID=984486 RepID=A0A1E3QK47_9ASCO|nr:uncharacterized protein BABINDRAFT_10095 [Babjeviella inositovora NRRL Y-12698]ODQ77452.1 hypothetical protein BABINDRAFT_10095 [Babjeviella inositovora NRRL Y-12698]
MILGVLFIYEVVVMVPIHLADCQHEVVDGNGIVVLAEVGGDRLGPAVEIDDAAIIKELSPLGFEVEKCNATLT